MIDKEVFQTLSAITIEYTKLAKAVTDLTEICRLQQVQLDNQLFSAVALREKVEKLEAHVSFIEPYEED